MFRRSIAHFLPFTFDLKLNQWHSLFSSSLSFFHFRCSFREEKECLYRHFFSSFFLFFLFRRQISEKNHSIRRFTYSIFSVERKRMMGLSVTSLFLEHLNENDNYIGLKTISMIIIQQISLHSSFSDEHLFEEFLLLLSYDHQITPWPLLRFALLCFAFYLFVNLTY